MLSEGINFTRMDGVKKTSALSLVDKMSADIRFDTCQFILWKDKALAIFFMAAFLHA